MVLHNGGIFGLGKRVATLRCNPKVAPTFVHTTLLTVDRNLDSGLRSYQ
jgi:hypothetical protein